MKTTSSTFTWESIRRGDHVNLGVKKIQNFYNRVLKEAPEELLNIVREVVFEREGDRITNTFFFEETATEEQMELFAGGLMFIYPINEYETVEKLEKENRKSCIS